MLDCRALMFNTQHHFFEVFDRKLQQYIEAGLVRYNMRTYIERSDPKKFEKHEKPYAVLALGELEAGFVVCMLPLVLSILVFSIEWIPTLKDLIVALFIFKNFFDVKKTQTVRA